MKCRRMELNKLGWLHRRGSHARVPEAVTAYIAGMQKPQCLL